MTAAQSFGKTLARIREDQGFASAHAFYKSRDGRRSFQMTFRNYLNVEQGKNVPKPERVEAIASALGLEAHSAPARELAEAYLAAMGLTKIARMLQTRVEATPQADDSALLEQAARQALKHQTVHLTEAQWKLVAEDFEAYVCDDLLQMTDGGLTPAELAKMSGLPPARVKRALAALSRAGLAEAEAGRARSLFEGKSVAAPPNLPGWVGINAALLKNQERLAAEGALVQNSVNKLRLTPADLQRLRRHVEQLSLLSGLYERTENSSDSAVYLVRGQVFRVLPRKSAVRN